MLRGLLIGVAVVVLVATTVALVRRRQTRLWVRSAGPAVMTDLDALLALLTARAVAVTRQARGFVVRGPSPLQVLHVTCPTGRFAVDEVLFHGDPELLIRLATLWQPLTGPLELDLGGGKRVSVGPAGVGPT